MSITSFNFDISLHRRLLLNKYTVNGTDNISFFAKTIEFEMFVKTENIKHKFIRQIHNARFSLREGRRVGENF